MKISACLSFLLLLLISVSGCVKIVDDKSVKHQAPQPSGPCEVVGPWYDFSYKEGGYDISSLQPVVSKKRTLLLLRNANGRTEAFMIQKSNSSGSNEFVEKITLSTSKKVLKLEGFGTGLSSLKFRGKSYNSFVSVNRGEWLPLAKPAVKSLVSADDVALMEKSWDAALRIDYVSQCIGHVTKASGLIQPMGLTSVPVYTTTTTNCFMDNESCQLIWDSWGDIGSSSRDELSSPPLHDDWYPHDIGAGSGSDVSTSSCDGKPAPSPNRCTGGKLMYGRGPTKALACSDARARAANVCSYQFTCKACRTCKRKGVGYKATLKYKCKDLPPDLVPIPDMR